MENQAIIKLPVAVLRGMVAFPNTDITFDAGRRETIAAIEEAMRRDKMIFMASQIDIDNEKVGVDSFYKIGVVGEIRQVLKLPGGISRVIVSGKYRAESTSASKLAYIESDIDRLYDFIPDMVEAEAYIKEIKLLFQDYFALNNRMPADSFVKVMSVCGLPELVNMVANLIPFQLNFKQELLEISDASARADKLSTAIASEAEILELQKKLDIEVKKSMDKNQKEYFLREQRKAIDNELGEGSELQAEVSEYKKKLDKINFPEKSREKIDKELERLSKMTNNNVESSVIRSYLDTILSIPWEKVSEENTDINNAEKILNEDHYGMEKVKKSILLNLAVRQFNARGSNILCLVGPPGVGKTSIAKSVAKALGRNYVRISLGGIHDEADIRGHRKTYIGSMPGRIINAIIQAGTSNPLILLDEVDKIGSDYRGDPSAALLEVLDSEQNCTFTDHYTEIPFDLSNVMFITTANSLETVSRPLLDRMDVIELSGYTRYEKLNIAKQYLFPKALEKTGLTSKKVTINQDAIYEIIDYYTRESGVRNLERELIHILSEVAMQILKEDKGSFKITKKHIAEFLGNRKYLFEAKNKKGDVGVVRGLAWTQVGGETLTVEANIMDGSGNIELTGKLGDVMKESAVAAISYIRSVSAKYKLPEFYKTKDIHIHVPEGAVPKDGPSAGITMATAVFSALSGKKVRSDIAMTGEITLRGRVLPIGGLKEKSLAAFRAGIKTVIIPNGNKPDISEIPKEVSDEMEFIPVESMDEVLKIAIN